MTPSIPQCESWTWRETAGKEFSQRHWQALHLTPATIIKSNRARTVSRLCIDAIDVHVKYCRPVGIRAWMRECLRPAKAILEYRNLIRLQQLGIPTLTPLAAASAARIGPADSMLVTRSEADARTLGDFLEKQLPTLAATEQTICRQRLARGLGVLLAQIIAVGVCHDDMHPGNILLNWTGAKPSFQLLDVHDVRFDQSVAAAIRSIVHLNRWFILRATRSDRLRCWQSLKNELHRRRITVPMDARQVEAATVRSNTSLWRGRQAVCCSTNRRFQKFSVGDYRGFAVRSVSIDEIRSVIARAGHTGDDMKVIKHSRSSTVVELHCFIAGEMRRCILKRFRIESWRDRLRSVFRPSACIRSWRNGHGFRASLLPTPQLFAGWQEHRFGLPGDGYLLQELVPGVSLHECLRELQQLPVHESLDKKRQAIEAIARFVRDMHDRGWSHRDLKAGNLLVEWREGTPIIHVVDLVGARLLGRIGHSRRQKDIARLNASFLDVSVITRSDRLRFLSAYEQWGVRGGLGWKRNWKSLSKLGQSKQEKNRRLGRVLA
jgi:tRNA A-37 threonylcarbamoyl transferase component Bud32